MINIILSLITAFAITFVSLPVIINIAELKDLYDVPDARKIHARPIASLGGVGIFAGVVLACLAFMSFTAWPELQYFVVAALIIFFTGIKDDIIIISPAKKMMGQALAALVLVVKTNLLIADMKGLLGIYQLPIWVALPLTLLVIVFIINAFNLIDGVDGLAGTLGCISATIFGYYFMRNGLFAYAVLGFALSGSLLAFLCFNYHPARIFMGDTGSLLTGLVNAVLLVKFLQVAPDSSFLPTDAAPAVGLAILAIPILDTVRVFLIRISNRRSPFSPDRNHIHHLLLSKGLSHSAVTTVLGVLNISLVVLAFSCQRFNLTLLTAALPLVFGMFVWVVHRYLLRPEGRHVSIAYKQAG